MQKSYWVISVFLLSVLYSCQTKINSLKEVLYSNNTKIERVVDSLEKYSLQIIYTKIVTQNNGEKSFIETHFQTDSLQYFYPASTVKLPVAILAIQKINKLQQSGIDISIHTPFQILDKDSKEIIVNSDTTHAKNKLTIAHLIKKIFLVSDNNAYNYLFDFLGRDYIYHQLKSRGYNHTQIKHKFKFGADNLNTPFFEFYNKNELVYKQPSIASKINYNISNIKGLVTGEGFLNTEDKIVNEPFNFSEKNYMSLTDLNAILKAIIFPEEIEKKQQFNLTKKDYKFLKYWMGRTTFESDIEAYKTSEYFDSYNKFFLFGDSKKEISKSIRSFNKVGNAYGTLTETAYIQDKENNVEFMLSATILVNKNQIYNDGVYEYDSVGIPFLAELARQLYNTNKKK